VKSSETKYASVSLIDLGTVDTSETLADLAHAKLFTSIAQQVLGDILYSMEVEVTQGRKHLHGQKNKGLVMTEAYGGVGRGDRRSQGDVIIKKYEQHQGQGSNARCQGGRKIKGLDGDEEDSDYANKTKAREAMPGRAQDQGPRQRRGILRHKGPQAWCCLLPVHYFVITNGPPVYIGCMPAAFYVTA
jgi:hypothetical protein